MHSVHASVIATLTPVFAMSRLSEVVCRRARHGDPAALARTQTSVAVSADGEAWFVLNAAPDLRAQIQANPVLWPRDGLRSSRRAARGRPGERQNTAFAL